MDLIIFNGGRTRIRTRVAGLEGQSDIQLHYTSNQPEKYLFDELWVWDIKVDEHICDNEMASWQSFYPMYTHSVCRTMILLWDPLIQNPSVFEAKAIPISLELVRLYWLIHRVKGCEG